jgi:hypothetical protein
MYAFFRIGRQIDRQKINPNKWELNVNNLSGEIIKKSLKPFLNVRVRSSKAFLALRRLPAKSPHPAAHGKKGDNQK